MNLQSLSNDELMSLLQQQQSSPTAPQDGDPADLSRMSDDQLKSAYRTTKPDIGGGTAALEGFLSGASGNFRDEVYGASKASGLPEWLGGFRAPVGAARLAYENMTGSPGEATKTYEGARDEKRALQKTAQEQYPGTSMLANIGGAVALPVGRFMQAATLPARVGRSASVGAGYGAVSGFGGGEGLADSATGALSGGAIGAGVGAVAPPLVEGAIQAAGALTRPIATAMRGAMRPEAEAGHRVIGALKRDAAADPNAVSRLTAQEFAANSQHGGPAKIMDLGGELTRGLARSAANTSPEGRGVLNRAIDERFEGQSGRVTDWLNDTFNFPSAQAQQQALDQTGRQSNRQAYARAYQDGDHGLWSPELERLTSSQDVVGAMRDAVPRGKSRAVTQGFGGFNPGVAVDQSGNITFQRGPTGAPTYPNLQFWDYTKRGIDDSANAARRAGRNDEADVLGLLATRLRGELDRLVPSYQQARSGAAQFFGAQDALEAGQNFVTSRMKNADARIALARMSPLERQLFQDGYVSRFVNRLDEVGDRRNVLRNLAQSPAEQERLAIALGPSRAKELEARLRIEDIMDSARGAVQGNSTTARQLAELGFAGGAGSLGAYGTYNLDPAQMTAAAISGALLAGKKGIDHRVARQVADMLVSNDPRRLTQGINIVARNDRFMDALRTTDQRVARAGVQQAPVPALPALQAPGTGRAEED